MFSLQLKWMGYNVTNRRLAERSRGEGSHMRSAAGGITAIMRVQVGGWVGGCWLQEHYSATSAMQHFFCSCVVSRQFKFSVWIAGLPSFTMSVMCTLAFFQRAGDIGIKIC